jgi:hypothetical protein
VRGRLGRRFAAAAAAAFVFAVPAAAHADPLTVSITFDDGLADQFQARDALAARGMHATFYVNSDRLDIPGRMTTAQLHQLEDAGNEIGGHTIDHPDLPTIERASPDEARRQICDDRSTLLNKGLHVVNFAYPFGRDIVDGQPGVLWQMVKDCGYASGRDIGGLFPQSACTGSDCPAFTCNNCPYSEDLPAANQYAIRSPDSVKVNTDMTTFENLISQAESRGGWVPVVFHHICDQCNIQSITAPAFNQFLDFLAQERDAGRIVIRTIQDVIGGPLNPPVVGPPFPTPAPAPRIALTPRERRKIRRLAAYDATGRTRILPIVLYRGINDQGGVFVSPASFARQMLALARAGVKPVTLKEYNRFAIRHATHGIPSRPVAIVFQGGRMDTFLAANTVLKARRFRALLFYGLNGIDGVTVMTRNELNHVAASGPWDVREEKPNSPTQPGTPNRIVTSSATTPLGLYQALRRLVRGH